MTAAPLDLVIIGAGSIGRRHIEVAQACPRTRIAAVVEPHDQTRARLAAQGLPVVASLDDAPQDARAAIIATPTPDHHASALACLDRGLPILLEKPIAASLDEARAVAKRAADTGLPCIVGHHRRCHPFSQAARQSLHDLGDLVGVQGLWSLRKHDSYFDIPWHREPGAGPLMTNLSHEIDLLHFLLGPITDVSALTSSARRNLVIEDTAALSLRFANGALGSFLMSDAGASPWAFEAGSGENPAIAASGEDYLRIVGTRGALAFPSLTHWAGSGVAEVEWSRPLVRHAARKAPPVDPLLEQIGRFAALLDGAPDDVLCDADAGIAALEMTLATALSAQTGHPVRAGGVPGEYRGI